MKNSGSQSADSGNPTAHASTPGSGRPSPQAPAATEKLHRAIARSGIASRRNCEEIIQAGRVRVDGQVERDVAARVPLEGVSIEVDGEIIQAPKFVHFAFYKPRGVVCTNSPQEPRPRVIDYFRHQAVRLYTVGRLDEDSEGLIFVTNDGAFAQSVAHPRHEIRKTYEVTVLDRLGREDMERIAKGVWIAEGKTLVDDISIQRKTPKATILRMVLCEGKNREVRRILARLGYKVRRLRRTAIGTMQLGSMKPGMFRMLQQDEIKALLDPESAPPPNPRLAAGPAKTKRTGSRVGTRGNARRATGHASTRRPATSGTAGRHSSASQGGTGRRSDTASSPGRRAPGSTTQGRRTGGSTTPGHRAAARSQGPPSSGRRSSSPTGSGRRASQGTSGGRTNPSTSTGRRAPSASRSGRRTSPANTPARRPSASGSPDRRATSAAAPGKRSSGNAPRRSSGTAPARRSSGSAPTKRSSGSAPTKRSSGAAPAKRASSSGHAATRRNPRKNSKSSPNRDAHNTGAAGKSNRNKAAGKNKPGANRPPRKSSTAPPRKSAGAPPPAKRARTIPPPSQSS